MIIRRYMVIKKIFLTLCLSFLFSILFTIIEIGLFSIGATFKACEIESIGWLFGEVGLSGSFFGIPSGSIFGILVADKLIYHAQRWNIIGMIISPLVSIVANYFGLIMVMEIKVILYYVFGPVLAGLLFSIFAPLLVGLLCLLVYYLLSDKLIHKVRPFNILGIAFGILLSITGNVSILMVLNRIFVKLYRLEPFFSPLLVGLLCFLGYRLGLLIERMRTRGRIGVRGEPRENQGENQKNISGRS